MAHATLETERLFLRPFVLHDFDVLASLHAEESFWWYPFRRGLTADETRMFLEGTIDAHERGEFAVSAVVLREDQRLAGWAGLSIPSFLPEVLPAVEVGWRLGEAFRGRGYASEAARAWVDYGFQQHALDEILSIYEPENQRSGAMMQRLGFELDRETIHPAIGVTLHVMKLTRERWSSRSLHPG